MSVVIGTEGSALNSGQFHLRISPVSDVSVNSQSSRRTRGVGPAESTGKSSVRYCPGGRLASLLRRRPTNPGETIFSSLTLRVFRAFSQAPATPQGPRTGEGTKRQ